MTEYIADGEIHPLSECFAYIVRFFPEHHEIAQNAISISEIQRDFCSKYAQYLMKFDQGTVLKILINHLMPSVMGLTGEDHQFIYRPASVCSMLAQNASLALKFKRSTIDNLDQIKEMDPLNEQI